MKPYTIISETSTLEKLSDFSNHKKERRYDLDWLRVIAILLVLYFHTGMLFVAEWGWHIKNKETSYLHLEWMFFLSRWRMALLFLISGIGTYYAFGFRNPFQYITERFKRLVIPLLFGMFVIVPPQIYIERLYKGESFKHYLEFYPSVFEFVSYPLGSFSWHHLWFVAYLFIYSLLATPIFLYFRSTKGKRLVEQIARRISIYWFSLPLALVFAGLIIPFPGPQNLVDDWAMFLYYFLFFVFGYLISTHPTFWVKIEQNRKKSLIIGFICIVIINYFRWNNLEPKWEYSMANMLYLSIWALNAWCWVMAILGYGKKYLNFNHPFLRYANEAIYPFYILHQTVIVVIGYYVIQVEESIWAKFWFTSTVSLLLSLCIYDFLIRPYHLTRFLFGVKKK